MKQSPVHDSGDSLPRSKRCHILQLLVWDWSRYEDLLRVTGTQPDITHTHTHGSVTHVNVCVSVGCVCDVSPVVVVNVGDSPVTVCVKAHPLHLTLKPVLRSSCQRNHKGLKIQEIFTVYTLHIIYYNTCTACPIMHFSLLRARATREERKREDLLQSDRWTHGGVHSSRPILALLCRQEVTSKHNRQVNQSLTTSFPYNNIIYITLFPCNYTESIFMSNQIHQTVFEHIWSLM